jgi:hypothetical protein
MFVDENGIFITHFSIITKQPDTGPIENPASKAGISENCSSKNDGKMIGTLNLQKKYNTKESAVSMAIFAK